MKFLIALSILATSTAFAQPNGEYSKKIKCYEPAEQGRRGDLAYVLEDRRDRPMMINEKDPVVLHVVYPFQQPLKTDGECLVHPSETAERKLSLCRSEGQTINGLVPFEAEYGRDEETVYCEKRILRYLENDNYDFNS